MSTPRVLLADAASPWHATLLAALGEDAHSVEIIDDGEKLRQALAEPERQQRRVIIVGDGLSQLGGLDALFVTAKVRGSSPEPKPGAPAVLLIIDLRHDMELLNLLRARGVHGFFRRTDAVEDVAAKIRSCLYLEQRVAPREPVKAKAQLEVGGKSIAGMLEDLSVGGAMIVVPSKKLQPLPPIASTMTIETIVGEVPLRLPCALRRVNHRKALLGDRVALGVSFSDLDFDQQKALETALDQVRATPMSGDVWIGRESISRWGG